MKLLYKAIYSLIGMASTSQILENAMKNYDTDVQPPVDTVSIIMPAYNEKDFIEKAASSIRYQSIILNYPEYFEFIVVDNGSTDDTIYLATAFADKVVQSSRGKLSARNYGANLSSGNIIVAVDSDVYYPYHWLNTLLKPFRDPNIIGTTGTILDYNFPGIPSTFYIIGSALKRVTRPLQMQGANCAYYKHIFNKIGQFNENINQFDVKQMVDEEEINFGKRLSNFGRVTYKFNAGCIHIGSIRTGCRMGYIDRFSDACMAYKFGIERFG